MGWSALGKKLVRVENFLNEPHRFTSSPATDDERALALAKTRLEAVAARQRDLLNVISETAEIDSANDLRAQRDIIPYEHDMSGAYTPPFTPIAMAQAVADARKLMVKSEAEAQPAILPIITACR
jgi:hypothetical protein